MFYSLQSDALYIKCGLRGPMMPINIVSVSNISLVNMTGERLKCCTIPTLYQGLFVPGRCFTMKGPVKGYINAR